jgi:hypothetical protein
VRTLRHPVIALRLAGGFGGRCLLKRRIAGCNGKNATPQFAINNPGYDEGTQLCFQQGARTVTPLLLHTCDNVFNLARNL